jgi:protein TonB
MERTSRKDLMLSGLLAILVHVSLALLTWNLAGDRASRFKPAGLADAMTIDLVARRPAAVVTNRGGKPGHPSREQARTRSDQRDAMATREFQQPETPALGPPLEVKESVLVSPGETSPASSLTSESAELSDVGSGRSGSGQSFTGSGAGQQTESFPGFVESRPPRYGQRLDPEYPEFARRRGYQGTALFRVRVLADGRVAAVQIRESSGYEILDSTASKAVWTWRFTPALDAGKPVASWVLVPITFRLQ